MKLKVHSIRFDADSKLIDFIHEKSEKLYQVYDKIINGEVFLRLSKSKTIKNKVTEIKLKIPGKDLFAKKQCNTFEEAIDLAISALQKQLLKYKEKTRKR